jgi:hypothetical protein
MKSAEDMRIPAPLAAGGIGALIAALAGKDPRSALEGGAVGLGAYGGGALARDLLAPQLKSRLNLSGDKADIISTVLGMLGGGFGANALASRVGKPKKKKKSGK